MKKIIIKTLLIMFFISVLFLSNAYATKIAVLVGISSYPVKEYNLPGGKNDIILMKNTLIQAGYTVDNNFILENEKATKEGIINLVNSLKRNIGMEDTLLFYFSGHGARTRFKGEENTLPVILPYDFRILEKTSEIENSITVKDLVEALSQLDGKKIVIIDACQSSVNNDKSGGELFSEADKYPQDIFLIFGAYTGAEANQYTEVVKDVDGNTEYVSLKKGITLSKGELTSEGEEKNKMKVEIASCNNNSSTKIFKKGILKDIGEFNDPNDLFKDCQKIENNEQQILEEQSFSLFTNSFTKVLNDAITMNTPIKCEDLIDNTKEQIDKNKDKLIQIPQIIPTETTKDMYCYGNIAYRYYCPESGYETYSNKIESIKCPLHNHNLIRDPTPIISK